MLEVLEENKGKLMSDVELCEQLNAIDAEACARVSQVLRTLKLQGYIEERQPSRYRLRRKDKVSGVVDCSSGQPMLLTVAYNKPLPITDKYALTLQHGDTVRAFIKKDDRNRLTADVFYPFEEPQRGILGTIEVLQKYAWFIPDQQKYRNIMVPFDNLNGAKDGNAVVVEIVQGPPLSKMMQGQVTAILGQRGDPYLDLIMRLKQYNFNLSFTKAQEEEALDILAAAQASDEEETIARTDLRHIPTFTIDPSNSPDLDDALSICLLENGNFEVGVHTADISYYLQKDSELDKEAYLRGTCVYLTDRVIPMLPGAFTEHCSLLPGVDKRAFSVLFEINDNGKILRSRIEKTLVRSQHQFTYREALKVIESGRGAMAKELLQLSELAQKRHQNRIHNGAISFEGRTKVQFKFDKHKHPIKAVVSRQNLAVSLVEEFVLLTNRTVAEQVRKLSSSPKMNRPFIYRVHAPPNPWKFGHAAGIIRGLYYQIERAETGHMISKQISKLLNSVRGQSDERLLNFIALKSMGKAKYVAKRNDHYALGFTAYTHFTSPLRRYVDIVVHRLLTHYIVKHQKTPPPGYSIKNLQRICEHLNTQLSNSKEVQRNDIHLKSLEYMEDHIDELFAARIYQINEDEIMVELAESGITGRVIIARIKEKDYFYDKRLYRVVSPTNLISYKIGDKVLVALSHVDVFTKIITFSMIKPLQKARITLKLS